MTNMKEDLEDMKHNPWLVTNLEDFLYYNCPECDNKTQSKAVFINHAYLNHPRVSELSFILVLDQMLVHEQVIRNSKTQQVITLS